MANPKKCCSFLVFGILVMTADAHAYLDPGTGSMILQALVAGFLGLAVMIRTYWHKVRTFFKPDPPVEESEGHSQE